MRERESVFFGLFFSPSNLGIYPVYGTSIFKDIGYRDQKTSMKDIWRFCGFLNDTFFQFSNKSHNSRTLYIEPCLWWIQCFEGEKRKGNGLERLSLKRTNMNINNGFEFTLVERQIQVLFYWQFKESILVFLHSILICDFFWEKTQQQKIESKWDTSKAKILYIPGLIIDKDMISRQV